MYSGTVAEATPTPRPTTIRPPSSAANVRASAISTAPAVKTTAAKISTRRRPSSRFAGPLHSAPSAASATVLETVASTITVFIPKYGVSLIIAPDTTPVS